MPIQDENRFELREPIRSLLKTYRKLAGADACALYLINYEMDVQEKESELFNRFDKNLFEGESKLYFDELLKLAKGSSDYKGIIIIYVNPKEEENDIANTYVKGNKDNLIFEYIKLDDYLKESKKKYNDIPPYDVLRFIGVCEDERCRWNIDYKNRPDKYIVFNHPPLKDAGCIVGEGATCLALRRGKPIYFNSRDIMLAHLSRINRERDDLRRNIHNKCQKLLALPLKQGNTTRGVIRFDIYNQNRNFKSTFVDNYYNNKEENPVLSTFGEAIIEMIDECTVDAEKRSYTNIYRGIQLLDALKSLNTKIAGSKDEFPENYRVYKELLLHLFFVFKRHTYIGEDEIMKRVKHFADDLGKAVGLSNSLSFGTSLELFKSHEDLMLYETSQYRDHFMHQFHVFVVGYIILNHIGFDNIAVTIKKRLKTPIHKYENIDIKAINVLRIWVLTAFFHDICYLFEEFEDGIATFLEKMLKMKIPIKVDWASILYNVTDNDKDYSYKNSEGSKYAKYIQNMILLFKSMDKKERTNRIESFGTFIQAILGKNDHAVLSALYLIDQYESLHGDQKNHVKEVEFYLAALAISIHNGIYKYLMMGQEYQLSFESFPLEFLLIYCDLIQEWGRTKRTKAKIFSSKDSPILEKLDIMGNEEVSCTLKYNNDDHPSRCELQNYADVIKTRLRSKIRFKVKYMFQNENPLEVQLNS